MSLSFIAELLDRIAPRIGATVVYEPEFRRAGYVQFDNGVRAFFRDNRFNLNPVGAARVVQDKAFCSAFLRRFGFRTPEELTFWREGDFPLAPVQRHIPAAAEFAARVGYPVYLKPVSGSQGLGIRLVWSEDELVRHARRLLAGGRVGIVQRRVEGRDYRVVVLDDEVISAYERIPLQVTGDGAASVAELLHRRQREFRVRGRDTTIRIDARIRDALSREGLGLNAVPEPGRVLRLLEVANLSTGGESLDVTARLDGSVAEVAIRAAREFRLRFCGVDLVTPDATRPGGACTILELNSAPGLDHYADPDPAAQERHVDALYTRLLLAVARSPDIRDRGDARRSTDPGD